jgi:hypothetical protein
VSQLRNALAGLLTAVAIALCLAVSSDVGFAATQRAATTVQRGVLVDQQVFDLELTPGTGNPPVDQARALKLAATYLPGSSRASGVESKYVLVTFRDARGAVAGGVEARPVWLVTFRGVSYSPSGSSASVCACAVVYQRPNTIATIDAETGTLVSLAGADN